MRQWASEPEDGRRRASRAGGASGGRGRVVDVGRKRGFDAAARVGSVERRHSPKRRQHSGRAEVGGCESGCGCGGVRGGRAEKLSFLRERFHPMLLPCPLRPAAALPGAGTVRAVFALRGGFAALLRHSLLQFPERVAPLCNCACVNPAVDAPACHGKVASLPLWAFTSPVPAPAATRVSSELSEDEEEDSESSDDDDVGEPSRGAGLCKFVICRSMTMSVSKRPSRWIVSETVLSGGPQMTPATCRTDMLSTTLLSTATILSFTFSLSDFAAA
eukprot:2968797-Rhodomonas_salina.1